MKCLKLFIVAVAMVNFVAYGAEETKRQKALNEIIQANEVADAVEARAQKAWQHYRKAQRAAERALGTPHADTTRRAEEEAAKALDQALKEFDQANNDVDEKQKKYDASLLH